MEAEGTIILANGLFVTQKFKIGIFFILVAGWFFLHVIMNLYLKK